MTVTSETEASETTTTDRYTIISADCHAGGSHEMYREYLDKAYLDDFDAWRNKYKNPFRDLQDGGRIRNWDDDRRNGDLESDGIVAEVVFPNTVPPFFPSFVLFAEPPRVAQTAMPIPPRSRTPARAIARGRREPNSRSKRWGWSSTSATIDSERTRIFLVG